MDTDFSHILRGINWEGILEGDKTIPANELPNSSSTAPEGSSLLLESGTTGAVDGAGEKVVGGPGGGTRAAGVVSAPQPLPPPPPPPQQPPQQPQPQPPQQMQAMQMGHAGGAYYVNAAQYQPIGVSPPGCGQLPPQQFVFAQPGGQMMYVPMPYFQHAAYQHGSSPQHVYPAPQAQYYPAPFVQLQPEGQMMPSMPQHLQPQQPQYFAPPQFPPRSFVANTPLQKVEVSESDLGSVHLFPGARLPQGTQFLSLGVPPTSHYSFAYAGGSAPKPPAYNSLYSQQGPHHSVVCSNEANEARGLKAGADNAQSHIKSVVS